MGDSKPFWPLSRRDLFKLLPSGVVGLLPTSLVWAEHADGMVGQNAEARAQAKFLNAPPKAQAKKWLADWIWEPVYGGKSGDSSAMNLFVYFRKLFDLDRSLDVALAQISADSRYQLYVNGQFVGRGPARFDPTWQYYDQYDIAHLLRPGKNVVAALAHYYGQPTGWYTVGRPGFIFECTTKAADGERVVVKSDASWRVLRAPMWTQQVPRVSSALGFTELYDASKEVDGWNLQECDDSHWSEPHVISRISGDDVPLRDPYAWDNLVPRDIPMLMETEVAPAKVTMVGEVKNLPPGSAPTGAHQMSYEMPGPLRNCTVENAESLAAETGGGAVIRTTQIGDHSSNRDSYSAVIVLDFGREVTGRVRLELEGVANGIVDMGVCESLTDGRVTPTRNGLHFNRLLMRNGFQRWEAFEWDGFRYLQLTVRNCPTPIKLRKVAVNFTSYPVGNRGSFESNDSMLNKIWETSRYTVQLCMHDAYEDCPNREQRQWVGDAYVETKVNYSVFGDTKLAAKYLRQIAQSQRSDGIVMMFWPGDGLGTELTINIKDFVLHWISTVWEYYRYTGDQEMVRELFPNIQKALGWFEAHIDSAGLLANIPPWVFGDWSPIDRRDRNAILNALYYNILRESAQMATLAGDESASRKYQSLAERVKAGINRLLWDESRGVYVDANVEGVVSRHVGQQANVMCILYDIAAPDKRARILSYIFDEKRLILPAYFNASAPAGFDAERDVMQAQPFFMHWVNAALAHIGEFERLVGLIRSLWGNMIDAGATTIWETWSQKDSECHGWSATPAHDLMTCVLGVRGVTPGFGEIAIEPHPAGLEWARGVFPSVKGDIPVSWHSTANEFRIDGSLPPGTTASVLIPAQNGKRASFVQLNGNVVVKDSKRVGGVRVKAEESGTRVEIRKQGRYEIVSRY